jgi:putative flippase GtrA
MSLPQERLRREVGRFFRFAVVGVIGAVVDFGTFNLLNAVLGIWSVLASALSFTAAVTSNFFWNRCWTYPDSRSKPVARQAAQFAVVNLVGLFIRTPIFAFGEAPFIRLALHLPYDLPLHPVQLGRNLALAVAVIVVLFWNFAINRLWTYSDAP